RCAALAEPQAGSGNGDGGGRGAAAGAVDAQQSHVEASAEVVVDGGSCVGGTPVVFALQNGLGEEGVVAFSAAKRGVVVAKRAFGGAERIAFGVVAVEVDFVVDLGRAGGRVAEAIGVREHY